ncbi:hypothetical protein [Streptomyces goshikiensis]|uniref:DUF6197 family protein n=1 Tax=Streptomyces goshikiensis TaxID=1942 RepID=UPI002E14F038|nr:hypothetical protein OG224_06815 [Streptomyces goshikiensis]
MPETIESDIWSGLSGEPTTGEQVAAHLDAIASLMRRENWDPQLYGPASDRRLETAFRETVGDGQGNSDTRYAGRQIIEHLLRSKLAVRYVNAWAWSEHPVRTLDDVLTVLAEAATFARTHGPR